MVHSLMMPPIGKSTKTLQRAWEESGRPGGWGGGVLGYFHPECLRRLTADDTGCHQKSLKH